MPLYKIYAFVLGEDPSDLRVTLKQIGVRMTERELRLDPRPLLCLVLRKFFRYYGVSGMADMLSQTLPAPNSQDERHIKRLISLFPADSESTTFKSISRCDQAGPLMVLICKIYASSDVKSYSAFGKVMCGTIRTGQKVNIFREGFSVSDQEDFGVGSVSALRICQARHNVSVDCAVAGNWVLID